MKNKLEFYAEYDEESQCYVVFDNKTGKCYYQSCEIKDAEDRALEMNN